MRNIVHGTREQAIAYLAVERAEEAEPKRARSAPPAGKAPFPLSLQLIPIARRVHLQGARELRLARAHGGFPMNERVMNFTQEQSTPQRVVVAARRLVRGEESACLREVAALLANSNVELDLSGVEAIDAAGIAALLQLAAQAHDLRRSLRIVAVSRHVKETLTLVGLEEVLLSHNVSARPQSGPYLETAAA